MAKMYFGLLERTFEVIEIAFTALIHSVVTY